MIFLSAALSFFHRVEVEKSQELATAWSTRPKYSPRNPAQGAMAPRSIDSSSSLTTSSGSTSKRVPSPSQRSQAPYGELKEKFRGANSSKDRPQWAQARCWENVR